MPSDNTVTIGDWVASDGPQTYPDSDGICWILTGIDGWFGGLPVRSAPIDRPQSDGALDGPAPFGGRSISLAGAVVSPDKATLQLALDRLAAVLAGVTRVGLLTVDEAIRGVTRQASVRLDGPTLTARTGPCSADWSVSLFAADPSRYDASERTVALTGYMPGVGRTYDLTFNRIYGALGSSGIATVTNAGNRPTWPVYVLTGPLTNPLIQIVGGRAIKVLLTIPEGHQLIIDTSDRTVWLDGQSRRSFLTSDSQWQALPPGDSQFYFAADAGTGNLTAQWQDAYA